MTRSEYFTQVRAGFEALLPRAEALGSLSEAQLNAKTSAHIWSIGQQLDHLLISGDTYVNTIAEQMQSIPAGGDAEIKHSLIGGFILKSAGPGGNGPVPPPFMPAEKAHSGEIVGRYLEHLRANLALLPELESRDICRYKLASPGAKIIKLTVADIMAINAAHGERHLGQCDRIMGSAEFPGHK